MPWNPSGGINEVESSAQPSAAREEAISQLYREERLKLLRLATLLTGDRGVAEDLVHDAFVGLQGRWDRLSDHSSAAGYLRVSVVNASRSRQRRLMVTLKHARASEPESGSAADATALLADDHRAVIETLKLLPRRQREVLILRYWLELSESEIATTLGISRGTVKSTASRALHAMEHLLEEAGNGD